MKKAIALLTAIALAAAAMSGCSGQGGGIKDSGVSPGPAGSSASEDSGGILNLESQFPVTTEPVSMTIAIRRSEISGSWKEQWFWKWAEDKTKVAMDVQEYDSSAWPEKKQIMLATEELPDIFFSGDFTTTELKRYGQEEGYFVDLSGMIGRYAPNVQKAFADYPQAKAGVTCLDGKIYSLPMLGQEEAVSTNRAFINTNWLDTLGLPMPETLEGFYEALKAFQEKDPNGNGQQDEIPWSGSWEEGYLESTFILNAYGLVTGDGRIAVRDGEAVYIPLQEEFKEYLRYMNRLFEEGLLDPDMFSQPQTQYTAKAQQGNVGFALDGAPFLMVPGDNFTDYQAQKPLVVTKGDTPVYWKGVDYHGGRFVVTKACAAPEAAVRWADAFYDEEMAVWYWFGPPKDTEDDPDSIGWLENETGSYYYDSYPDGITNDWEYINKLVGPIACGAFGFEANTAYMRLYGKAYPQNDMEKAWREPMIQNVAPYQQLGYPDVYYSEEQQQTINELVTPLNDFVKQKEARFITGAESLDGYDSFLAELNKLGADQYQKVLSDAYKTFKQNS